MTLLNWDYSSHPSTLKSMFFIDGLPAIITTINSTENLPPLAHKRILVTSGSLNITIKTNIRESRNHQMIVYCCNNSLSANTWLIARKFATPTNKQQHSMHLSYYITRKLNFLYRPITLDTQKLTPDSASTGKPLILTNPPRSRSLTGSRHKHSMSTNSRHTSFKNMLFWRPATPARGLRTLNSYAKTTYDAYLSITSQIITIYSSQK